MFSVLYRHFTRIQRSWNFVYRFVFNLAYRYKRLRIQEGLFHARVMDWFLFRNIAEILGGNLRLIIISEGELPPPVHEFLQVQDVCGMERNSVVW